jgi:hypothetical protein
MIRGYLLRYLAGVAEGQRPLAAGDRLPVLLRPWVMSRATQVVSRCELATEQAGNEAHVHRLAYLVARGKEAPNPNDVVAVSEWFTAHRELRVEQGALLSLLLGAAAALVLVAAAIGSWTQLQLRTRTEPEAAGQEVAVAAAISEPTPGVPPALEVSFRDALPKWLVALDAESRDPGRVISAAVESQHVSLVSGVERENAALTLPLSDFLTEVERYARGQSGAERAHEVRALLGRLDDALVSAQVPYYIDADLLASATGDRRRVFVSTYKIRRRRSFASDEKRVVAFELVRLDTLNFAQSQLGYTRPEIPYALVLNERVEDFLVTRALPSMHSVDESTIVRDYHTDLHTEWVTPLEAAFHEDLRAEAATLLQKPALTDLAAAVVKRKYAFTELIAELRRGGVVLEPPLSYAYDSSFLVSRQAHLPVGLARAAHQAQQVLAVGALRAAYERLEESYLVSIAQHEAQHRLDFEAHRLAGIPGALAHYTGHRELDAPVDPMAERTNAELSAYLSQVAREPARARTVLISIIAFVMSRHDWGRPECYAALVIFDELARKLRIAHEAFVVDHQIERRELARVYSALRTHTGDDLSRAALAVWRDLYGMELPRLEQVD